MRTYTAVFEPASEGGFTVYIPALPGCISEGDTFEQAQENIQDALKGYLAVLKEDGDQIPEEIGDAITAKIVAPDPA